MPGRPGSRRRASSIQGQVTGAWTFQAGVLVQSSDIGDGIAGFERRGTTATIGDLARDGVRVTASIRAGDDDALGLIARRSDHYNYYRASIDHEGGVARIVSVVDGRYEVVAEKLSFGGTPRMTSFNLAEAQGNALRLYLDGLLILQGIDATHAAGGIDLYSGSSRDVAFERVEVQPSGLP